MAFDSSKVTKIGQVQRDDNGGFIVVSSVSDLKNSCKIDIRRFYTDKASNELKPTTKGIMLDTEILKDVLLLAAKGLEYDEVETLIEELQRLLEVGEDSEELKLGAFDKLSSSNKMTEQGDD